MLSRFATYKLSHKALNKLKKQGCSEAAIDSLSSIEEQFFPSPDTLIARVKKMSNHAEILEHETAILKYSRGYFRLDNWIKDKTTREWTEALIFALVVALVVRTFLFAPFRIPSGSMIPTIKIGDQIFASMFTYGIPVPFTDIKFFPQPIERGDIVIFPSPPTPEIDFIKRAIALEGETIEIRRDKVFINGKLLEEPYVFFDPAKRGQALRSPNVRNYGPKTVPAGHIFTMGDNRYNSHDGRFWGFVESKKVMGKGQIVYWSKEPRPGITGLFELDSYRITRLLSFLE